MKTMLIAMLNGYKRRISPMFPNACRFIPTCSEYAVQAITTWGVVRGLGLSVYRVLRCNPFCKGGYDPVPLRTHTIGR
jgi:hypothetical protein